MQIHELNQRKSVKESTDVVGPASIGRVGAQVLKNPAALGSSSALGSAQQAAAQSSAASSAAKLAAQGYKVGNNAALQKDPQQLLAQVTSNPTTQQMVKNLAGQWKTRGVGLAAKMSMAQKASTGEVAEAAAPIDNPLNIKDPQEQQLYNLFLKQQAANNATTSPDPTATKNAQAEVNQNLNDYAQEFQNWAEPKLRSIGVDYNSVMQDSWAAPNIRKLLTKLAIDGVANPESPKVTGLVEEFFNIAIATNQARQQTNVRPGRASAPSATGVNQQNDADILKNYGLSLSSGQLDALGTAMRRSADGRTVIRNTGNELLNAVARLAGFQVGAS